MSGLNTQVMIPIAILASGRGSNFDAILAHVREGKLAARIAVVISDRADAPVLEKARAAGIPAVHVAPRAELALAERRREHDARVAAEIERAGARFVVMAGYMRVVSDEFIERFRCERGYTRIVNVHPSLLPAFPGVDAYAQAYAFGAKVTGVTVHLVESEVDSGPVLAQEAFIISGCESASIVEKLGLSIEHKIYPETLAWVLQEKFEVERSSSSQFPGRLRVRPN